MLPLLECLNGGRQGGKPGGLVELQVVGNPMGVEVFPERMFHPGLHLYKSTKKAGTESDAIHKKLKNAKKNKEDAQK